MPVLLAGSQQELLLRGVHPDLVKVIKEAFENGSRPFRILEGLRTIERQRVLFAQKATKTMRSRHLTGHAVDIAPTIDGKVSWDWPLYYPLAAEIKEIAASMKIPIEWGGDWRTFKDGPHWQLPWKSYP